MWFLLEQTWRHNVKIITVICKGSCLKISLYFFRNYYFEWVFKYSFRFGNSYLIVVTDVFILINDFWITKMILFLAFRLCFLKQQLQSNNFFVCFCVTQMVSLRMGRTMHRTYLGRRSGYSQMFLIVLSVSFAIFLVFQLMSVMPRRASE